MTTTATRVRVVRTVDPSTGLTLADHPLRTRAEAFDALDRAWSAWPDWRSRSVIERAQALAPLESALLAHEDELAAVLTAEMGKPLVAARAEVAKTAAAVRHVVEHGPGGLAPDERPAGAAEQAHVRYDPLGPLLGIMPWNFPYWQSARFFLSALLAGNVVLIKPAPQTLGSAATFQSVIDAVGLPGGALQTVPTDVDVVGELVADPRLRGVSLTGSSRAGRAVAELAGRNLTKVVLELGGSDAFIVLPDADVAAAARAAVASRMQNGGQSCIAAKRFIVHRDVADPFVDALVDGVRALVTGDPTEPGVDVGPLVSAEALTTLEAQVDRTVAAGAHVATGGARLERPGHFYAPTVLTGVEPAMPCAVEEVFGPVAPVLIADTVDDAVMVADAGEYGLGASVWTADHDVAAGVAARLDVGMVFVNAIVASDARYPFGGVKNSGLGRELGMEGLREFTNAKLVRVRG